MLRGAMICAVIALLGFAGIASARLIADPTTTEELATGPTAIGITTPASIATTTAPLTTSTLTTSNVATTTKPVTTTKATTTTAATTTITTPAIISSTAASTLVITGHGWGHGIGMSQWGANGYAQHGWSYSRILSHYYRGTSLAIRPERTVRVLLLDGRKRVTISSDSPWKVTDGHGTRVTLPAGPLPITPDLAVSGQTLVSPLVFSPGSTPLKVGKAGYRGKILVVSNGKRLQVVNALALDSYVLGVVGSEMPSSWPAAALEAQAVAARSYALAEIENVVTVQAFDLYSDTRSQVYGGLAAESPRVTAAVSATHAQVVVYQGKVATTYFSSSSGGQTVSSADAWGKAVPYLVSVSDPYDTLSPYHDWGPVLMNSRTAARTLKVPGQLVSLTLTRLPAGRTASVAAVGTTGSVTLSSELVRSDLGLRSTWFSIGWLALTPPSSAVLYGGSVSLAGLVRDVSGPVSLEQKGSDGIWQPLLAVSPATDGTFAVSVKPTVTTQYRLAVGLVRAALVKVPVVPVVSATLGSGTVQGTIRPALSGAAVQLQRSDGAAWTTVATGSTDVAGAFAVSANLSPGSYRVRCAPGHGLSPGVSEPIVQT